MRWDERQVRLLAEMGLRQWTPPPHSDSRALAAAPPPVTSGPPPVEQPAAVPPSVRPVEALDWPALREAVAACTACGLCRTRQKPVFGTGHARAHLMVVGEAPGEQEDREGEPFVGKAGQLLDHMLQALGLGRGAGSAAEPGDGAPADPARCVYIANVLKCRPPLNRNPLPEEVAQCEPFLRRQVALVRPKVILAMGRFAVQSLLRSDAAVGKLRGRLHAFEGVPLVVTYHPAYLLRNPADKARAWDDLCLARAALREAGSPDPGA